MKTRAAVAWKAGAPLSIETVELEGPKAGEVLVEIKVCDWSSDVCSSDLTYMPQMRPLWRVWSRVSRASPAMPTSVSPSNAQIGRASCRERVCT